MFNSINHIKIDFRSILTFASLLVLLFFFGHEQVFAQTASFSSNTTSVPAGGGNVTFSWSASNHDGVTLHVNGQQYVHYGATGSRTIFISSNTTAKLDVWRNDGRLNSYYRSISVQSPPAPTCSLSVNTTSVPYGGGYVTASYSSSNATGGTLHPGTLNVGTSGSRSVYISSNTTLQYDVWNSAGVSRTCTRTVTVQPPPSPPTGSLYASPTSVPAGGGNVTFSWSASNHDGVTLHVNGQQYVHYGATGSRTIFISSNTTAKLDIWRNDGTLTSRTASVSVQSALPPPNAAFTVYPTSVPAGGGNVTFSWSAQNNNGVTLHVNGQEYVHQGSDGSRTLYINRDTTAKLDVWRNDGALISYTKNLKLDSVSGQPSSPKNLSAVCRTTADPAISEVTVSWGSVAGASKYLLRMDWLPSSWANTAQMSDPNTACSYGDGSQAGRDYCHNNLYGTSATVRVPTGDPFDWWVHSWSSTGVSSANMSSFVCGTVNPNYPPEWDDRPKNLRSSCSYDGRSVTLSWSDEFNTNNYPIRLDKNPTSWDRNASCSGWRASGDYCSDNQTSKSITLSIEPNTSYEWWVHSGVGNPSNGAFNCADQTITPPVVSITSSPSSVSSGGSSTISWATANVTSCTASNGWTGSKTASGGSQTISGITSNRVFTLSCTGTGGTASNSTSVSVVSPPTVTLTASPSSVTYGGNSTLSWTTTSATSCTASNGWTGSKTASGGSQTMSSLTSSQTYSISCTGPGGTASDSVTISVSYPLPTVSLVANPSSVIYGDTSILNWATANATSCTAFEGWTGNKSVGSGSQETGALTEDSSYRLVCTGPGGSRQSVTTVSVVTGTGATLKSDKDIYGQLVRPNSTISLDYDVGTSEPGTCTIKRGGVVILSITEKTGTLEDFIESGEIEYSLDCPGNRFDLVVKTLPEFQET